MVLAEGIAARQRVTGVELVVHFDDKVVVVAGITNRRRKRPRITHGKECENLVGGRGIESWIDEKCSGTGCGDVGRRRNLKIEIGADAFALPFVGSEEEGPVPDHRAAQRAAKIVVVEMGLRIGRGIEVVARVENGIAIVLVERTVKVVCAGTRDDIDDRTCVAAVFGAEL